MLTKVWNWIKEALGLMPEVMETALETMDQIDDYAERVAKEMDELVESTTKLAASAERVADKYEELEDRITGD